MGEIKIYMSGKNSVPLSEGGDVVVFDSDVEMKCINRVVEVEKTLTRRYIYSQMMIGG